MPRPRIDLEPYKEEILDLISQKTTHTDIRTILEERYNIVISRSTLKRSLGCWKPPIRHDLTLTPRVEIQDQVEALISQYNTSEILQILAADGRPLSERTIRRIRADLNIKLRLSPDQRQQQFDDLQAILICENIIGEVEDFGYRTLYRHLRSMGLFYIE
jgi:hypothetical protein